MPLTGGREEKRIECKIAEWGLKPETSKSKDDNALIQERTEQKEHTRKTE
jgi:hypothetical protein